LEQPIPDLTIPLPINNNDLESLFLEKEKSQNKSINHEQIKVCLEDENISDNNNNNKTFQQNDNQKDVDISNHQICEEGGDNNKYQILKTNDGEQMDIESQLKMNKFQLNEDQNEEKNSNENNLMDTTPNSK
jgi:hypothetical protein